MLTLLRFAVLTLCMRKFYLCPPLKPYHQMKRISLSVFLILISSFPIFAQDDPWVPTVDQLVSIPGSPEASAFAEYGKTPVSHYNGTPNITVPFVNLKGKS